MTSFWNILPPELHNAPALLAGILALLGLILWTAGVKVAKPLAAVFAGSVLAALGATLLPKFFAIDPLAAAIIGLATGLLLGALAFRLVQGLVLAACLGVVASGVFYQSQVAGHPLPQAPAEALISQQNAYGNALAALPREAQTLAQTLAARWLALPDTLRQSMLAIAAGAALVTLLVTWLLPRPTTWLMSAVGGVGLLIYGGFVLLNTFAPRYERLVPSEPLIRLAIIGCMVLVGMAIQRLYFWPGKTLQRAGAPAAA